MRTAMLSALAALALGLCLAPRAPCDEPPAEDEFAGLPHEERKAGADAQRIYRLIGPRDAEAAPAAGRPLLLVLPGGDGGPDFLPFVKRIHLNVLAKEWLVAQVVSVKWREDQRVVWPTKGSPVPGSKFSTEEFIEAVAADAAKVQKVDPARVFALGWSSSGPALYAHALTKKPSLAGWYIAQSVFHPQDLPPLALAKGRAFFLDHSPDDRTCPFADAQKAEEELKKARALVKLVTYEGGHGWKGNLWQRMKDGLTFLEEQRPRAARAR